MRLLAEQVVVFEWADTVVSVKVGIQFVQIGNDKDATEYLEKLDGDLQKLKEHRVRGNHILFSTEQLFEWISCIGHG